jgi:hypothetical protein
MKMNKILSLATAGVGIALSGGVAGASTVFTQQAPITAALGGNSEASHSRFAVG